MLDGFLHDIKWCGTCLGIEIAGELSYLRPSGHLGREGYQQGCTTYQCGIEEVIAQTTECHLGNTNGKQGTNDDNPDGEVGGQVETKQQTSKDSRTIAYGAALVFHHKLIDGPLEEDAGRNTRSTDNGRANAEEIERHEQSRYEGNDDPIHVFLNGVCSVCVRR